jgi:drug/metabolite transporter (DMT)-like permease
MNPAWLMVCASFLFATMGVCVKMAATDYSTGEIVFYRSVIGMLMVWSAVRWRGGSLKTPVPQVHFWRTASGISALCMWFYSIGKLPLATAMTLNYMSSVWMALFLIGGAAMLGTARIDGRLVATVLLGFAGVALILQPTIANNQLWHGLIGLISGIVAATAFLQVAGLAKLGEPALRIVFYFSLGGVVAGAGLATLSGAWHAHTTRGAALLLAIGLLATMAQFMMTRAYGRGKPLVNASLAYLAIVFSFGYGVWWFDDRITWSALVGMVLIVGSGIAATLLRQGTPAAAVANSAET